MALDDRRSLSNSRMGRKNGKVCSITVIFSRNDLLTKTQWNISQGSPAKCTIAHVDLLCEIMCLEIEMYHLFQPFWAKYITSVAPIIQNITGLHVHSAKKKCYSLKWTFAIVLGSPQLLAMSNRNIMHLRNFQIRSHLLAWKMELKK
jgi:hypothetical protein